MQQADATLRELGIRVVVVTFEHQSAAAEYVSDTGTRWPILVDEQRELYRAYSLERAKWYHLVGPRTLFAYAKEAMRGVFPRRPVADTTQQGGDVLVDPDGVVRFHHVGAGSGYRPTVAQILEARRENDPSG